MVNHHLFMADLAVRGGGYGEVIPDYEAVIFDEAHQIEEVATQYFGAAVSTWRLAQLRRDAQKTLSAAGRLGPELSNAINALGHQTEALAALFRKRDGEFELWRGDDPEEDRLKEIGGNILVCLDNVAARLEKAAAKDEDLETVARRSREAAHDLGFVLEGLDSQFVFWGERRGRGLFLRASPIDVSPFIQEGLLGGELSLVLTSATLTAGRSFDYIKERLGLWPETEGLMVESPFDYAGKTLLYVPRRLPAPRSPAYLPALAAEIEQLLHHSRGRAFVLFTSYRNMHWTAEALRSKIPWPCLVQGEAPRTALLERFKRETSSVLLATHSFWQGVDVPGESLSAVIIDKLPFPRPDQPLVRARSDRLREEGQDPFFGYSVPEAVITLKQGLGRLIRSENDRGTAGRARLPAGDQRIRTPFFGKSAPQPPDSPNAGCGRVLPPTLTYPGSGNFFQFLPVTHRGTWACRSWRGLAAPRAAGS